jgi:phenylacetate-CoA ligase
MEPSMKVAFSRKNLWERSPRLVRASIGSLLGLLPSSLLLGRSFRRHLALLEASQHWDEDRIREYQTVRLRQLATHASRAPYWRRVFRDADLEPARLTLDDLGKLPRLTREDVRQHGADMCTSSVERRDVDYVATSGSTGAPVAFYIGADRSPVEYSYLVAGWMRAGYELGTPLVVFRGRPIAPDRTGLRHEYDPVLRYHSYSVYHMADGDMARYVAHIRTLGPCYVLGYPSAIYALARHLHRTKTPAPPNIRGIFAESETFYETQRAFVEQVFGCRPWSAYGQTEKVVAAAECEGSSRLHVWPTYGICELVDEHGAPVTAPGRRGEIVGTSFLNSFMPFIRYRTGDYATLGARRCRSCGRNHLLLDHVRGHRLQEMLVACDGTLIPWTAVNMHDDTFAHVLRFQFRQHEPGVATLRIVPDRHFTILDQRRIAARLRHRLSERLQVRIELAGSVPLTPNGKAVYVDQRVPDLDRFEPDDTELPGEWTAAR